MAYLVDVEPFVVVVEIVKFAMGEFFIPEIVEPDSDHGADGGLGNDHPIYPAGIIVGRGLKEVLRRDGIFHEQQYRQGKDNWFSGHTTNIRPINHPRP